MTTQTIVNSNSIALFSVPDPQPGVINPSRSITKEDEVYLRNYTLAAAVISWDEGVFGTTLQVTAADITNICIAGDTVWYQINYYRAIPLNIEIFHAHRQRIQLHLAELDGAEEECQPLEEPLAAGDSVTCQLQPTQSDLAEFDFGRHHGQQDAQARLHPMYTKRSDGYSSGYLEGYQSVLNPTTQLGQVSPPAEWSVSYDSKWDWYRVYVGSRCIGHGSSYEEAERIAQHYIAADELIRRQNAAVLAAYSC